MLLHQAPKFVTKMCTNWHRRQQLLLLQLFLLSIATQCALANPVSSPEIGSKSSKSVNAAGQQQTTLKVSSQDPQLNSLSAYAAANSYAGLTDVSFKPSYKLPDMETNFTPMQSGVSVSGPGPITGPLPSPTPVLMQYLPPQSLNEGSIQYLQLIPTRPLIVPISPYLSAQQSAPYQPAIATDNSIVDYTSRPGPVLHSNNAIPPAAPQLVNVPGSHLPYGLQTYANAIQPYRPGFRINREIKDKNLPPGLSLNLHEYFPVAHDLPSQQFLRGRP